MLQNTQGKLVGSVPTLRQNNAPFQIDNAKSTNQFFQGTNYPPRGSVHYYEPRLQNHQTGSFHQSTGNHSYTSAQNISVTGLPSKPSQQSLRVTYNLNPVPQLVQPHQRKLKQDPLSKQDSQRMEKIAINLEKPINTFDIQKTATSSPVSLSQTQKYSIDGVAGKGTFGVVYKGKDLSTGQKIAHKKVVQDKKYKNRELEILQSLSHPNIIRLRESYTTTQKSQEYLNLIMDYYPENLGQIVKKRVLTQSLTKIYVFQILKALDYLSTMNIAHRDMKPHNILIDRQSNRVAICDFGSAKKLKAGEKNLAYICSRCFRAPQLIFGATDYTPQIDVWGLGCIIVQMINGQLPFMAESQMSLLSEIIKILGTPTEKAARQMNPNFEQELFANLPKRNPILWEKYLRTKDPLLIDLVSNILVYSPKRRLTPAAALKHPYFEQLRDSEALRKMKSKVGSIPNELYSCQTFKDTTSNYMQKSSSNSQFSEGYYRGPNNPVPELKNSSFEICSTSSKQYFKPNFTDRPMSFQPYCVPPTQQYRETKPFYQSEVSQKGMDRQFKY